MFSSNSNIPIDKSDVGNSSSENIDVKNNNSNNLSTGDNFDKNDVLPDVSIIDYGINNLKSVSKAFEKIGRSFEIISTPEKVLSAKSLILPGIGAFKDGMDGLKERGLIEPIKEKVSNGTPLLGICLGMQMLFDESSEFGLHRGLGLISGKVVSFRIPEEVNIPGYKVPHMGWNELDFPDGDSSKWGKTLLSNTKEKSDVYFVHSFYVIPTDKNLIIATSNYYNQVFASVIKFNNITGSQFHPEKSGEIGIKILETFCLENNL